MPANVFTIGDFKVPFAVLKVEMGLRKQVWQVTQAALGSVGAASTWRGIEIDTAGLTITSLIMAEGFEPGMPGGVVVTDADEAARLHINFVKRIHPGVDGVTPPNPPVWDCDHPVPRSRFARKLAHLASGIMPFNDTASAWLSVIALIEAKPLKRLTPSAPDPAKLNSKNEPATTALERELEELIRQMKKG